MSWPAPEHARAACERGVALHLWLCPATGQSEMRRYAIERGRIDEADSTHLFTGRPPAAVGSRLPSAQDMPRTGDRWQADLSEALQTLATAPGVASLTFSASALHTRVTNDLQLSPIRLRREWSLTGALILDDGRRRVPLAWSGPGIGPSDWSSLRAEIETLRHRLTSARPLPAGRYRVLLAPQPAALFLHEAIGHFAEAAATAEIELSHRLGCRIASERITVEDDPLAVGGQAAYEYDDDNVRALGPTRLVEGGRLVAQLHSRRSAERSRILPTANGRAATSWDLPLPRISNLLCRPAAAGDEELMDHLGSGLHLERLANARASHRWIEAEIVLARRVVGGRPSGPALSGGRIAAPRDALCRVEKVGHRSLFNANAMCGKAGQLLLTVGTAAPAMCLSELEVVR